MRVKRGLSTRLRVRSLVLEQPNDIGAITKRSGPSPSCFQKLAIPPAIVEPKHDAPNSDHEQEDSIDPMARGVPRLGLLGLVNEHADDLARGAPQANVEGDGEAHGGGGEDVGAQPAQERRDTGEGARGRHDQAAVARRVGVGGQHGRGEEPDGADGGQDGRVQAAGVEVVGRVGGQDLDHVCNLSRCQSILHQEVRQAI